MKKSVMISLSPYWYYLIGEGIKKIEIRKTFPKSEEWNHIIECYMTNDKKSFNRIPKELQEKYSAHIGKVGIQIKCDSVFPIRVFENGSIQDYMFHHMERSCVPYEDIANYIGNDKTGYGWHIFDPMIYDKPRELSEFTVVDKESIRKCKSRVQSYYSFTDTGYIKNGFICAEKDDWCFGGCKIKPLVRPPQSWCYVESVV